MRKLLRVVWHALTVLGLLMVVVTLVPVDSWYATALAGEWNDPRGDTLIVLGGGTVGEEGLIGLGSYWRTVYAVRAWRQGRFRQMIITGEGAAPAMRDFAVAYGVPAASIRIDDKAASTRENALNVAGMLDAKAGTKTLLTSDYHMFRAHRAFEKAGIDVAPVPFPDAGKRAGRWYERWPVFIDLCRESVKIAYYKVRGWI